MKPKITVESERKGVTTQVAIISSGDTELMRAYDIDYESTDAMACFTLLEALRKAGIIELEADDRAKKWWGE
jgi:hypothetical protein